MKKGKFLFSFTGLFLFCLVLGLGLFLYCDSRSNDEPKPPPQTETVTIRVGGEVGEEIVIVEPEVIFVNHNDDIQWKVHDDEQNVISFVVYFGYDSPIGDQNGPTMHAQLSSGQDNRPPAKKVWHHPQFAGGRHTKYYVAVYYQPNPDEVGKVLIVDPEIIIPRR